MKKAARQAITATVLIVLFGIFTGGVLQRYLDERYHADIAAKVHDYASTVRAQLESIISAEVLTIRSAASYVAVHPELDAPELRAYSESILNTAEAVKNLAIARRYVVEFVHPLEGNESVLGLDYESLPSQLPMVEKTRRVGGPVIAGPLEVVQGGMAVVGRAPIFVDGAYWGIVSSIIDLDEIIARIQPFLAEHELTIAIRGIDGTGRSGPVFYGDKYVFRDARTIRRDVSFPNGSWHIGVAPADGWRDHHPAWAVINVVVFLAIAATLIVVYGKIVRDDSFRRKEALLQERITQAAELLDLFFRQSLDGFFFMMLDEPVRWDEETDKAATLDYVFDHQRITKINQAMLDQYRAREDEFIGLTPRDFFAHDEDGGKAVWRDFFDNGRLHIDTDERRFDGTPMTIEGDYIIITDNEGRITGHFGVQRDVTEVRDVAARLDRYVTIVDNNVITSQTDLDGVITYASEAFSKISGYSKEELIGRGHNIIRHPDMDDALFRDLWETITRGETWHGEIKNRRKDGGFYWVDTDISALSDRHGTVYGYMSVRQDITAKKQLEVISVTDGMTGLFNRQKIDAILDEQVTRFRRYDEHFAVIIFDVDRFKSINDTYGHPVGDRVLTMIARAATEQIRSTDVVGRWGGEEFLIVCPHTDAAGAAARAEKLRSTIASLDFALPRPVTASFGVTDVLAVQSESQIIEAILKHADQALYAAKSGGRDRVVTA